MYVKNFVICDEEEQYSENLIGILAGKKDTDYQMYLFHNPEEVFEFSRKKTIHSLLISETYAGETCMQISAQKKFVLVKKLQQNLSGEEREVYRYQNAEKIWSEVTKDEEEPPFILSSEMKTEGELIGVYSPVHRIGKTKFAIEMGKKLAEKVPVLYLNLEEYPGTIPYFQLQSQEGGNLGDLLYYARQERGNLGFRISTMVEQEGRLDYISPIPCLQDLQAVSVEDWIRLFEQILEQCIYEKIVLDLGDSIAGLFQILEKCTVIYTPYIEEKTAQAKLNRYVENLRRTGMESILEKTVQKKMKKRHSEKREEEIERTAII